MRILVTGANGFIGTHLIRYLGKCTGEEIATLGRTKPSPGTRHFNCPLSDFHALKRVIEEFKPEAIFHLSGRPPGQKTDDFPSYFEANTLSTLTLLEALEGSRLSTTVFLPSSVHLYSGVEAKMDENAPLSLQQGYAFSKYLAEEALRHHVEKVPTQRAVVGRIADCVGPGQGDEFPLPKYCKERVSSPLDKQSIPALRGFIDVRDLVNIVHKLVAAKGDSNFEIFNIASPADIGGPRYDTGRLSSRLTLYFRPLDQSLKDFWEWYRHSHPTAS